MKNLNQKLCLILTLLILSNCGLINNHYTIGYNLVKGFSPHEHKVKRDGENSFPANGQSVVSLNFVVDNTNKKAGVDTLWRKINDDGTFSKRITLTYLTMFKDGRTESTLEPGTYFLDGFRYGDGAIYVTAGAFTYLMANEPKGWDASKNQPLWFSFTLEKGKEVFVPDVAISSKCLSGSSGCSDDGLKISIKIDKEENKDPKAYKIGYAIKN